MAWNIKDSISYLQKEEQIKLTILRDEVQKWKDFLTQKQRVIAHILRENFLNSLETAIVNDDAVDNSDKAKAKDIALQVFDGLNGSFDEFVEMYTVSEIIWSSAIEKARYTLMQLAKNNWILDGALQSYMHHQTALHKYELNATKAIKEVLTEATIKALGELSSGMEVFKNK
jgi:hypothetical protein